MFPRGFHVFAKRLPLCQHAKIAIIPKGFHMSWIQLLPKILRKHPEMHFTVISAENHRMYIFSWNLAKLTWIPAIPSIWTPRGWKHQYFLRNIKVPGCVNSTKTSDWYKFYVILLETMFCMKFYSFAWCPWFLWKCRRLRRHAKIAVIPIDFHRSWGRNAVQWFPNHNKC